MKLGCREGPQEELNLVEKADSLRQAEGECSSPWGVGTQSQELRGQQEVLT